MTSENPRLRPFLAAQPDERDSRFVLVWDRLGISDGPQRFTQAEFLCLKLLTGEHDLLSLQELARQQNVESMITASFLETLIDKLERCLFLESPKFRRHVDGPIREPRCIGCYPGNPEELQQYLTGLFTGPNGAGLPEDRTPDDQLRAALIPHIDYWRGGATYTFAFKEIYERTDASLFVIIGTSHYSGHRFTLTRKNFKTPLGIVPTDQDYIDRLENHYGPGLFDDELMAHLPEHSIELEVVFLQYLYENKRPIRIVPLVVGSFQDCVYGMRMPSTMDDISRMINALRRVEEEINEPVCYIISGDLAHIGPKFGDQRPARGEWIRNSLQRDQVIIKQAEQADANRLFHVIAAEGNSRRICGLPPAYLTLEAALPRRGKLLHYNQYIHPQGHESVSFASMAFYQ